jgi:putative phage-type endonuclease
MAEPDDFAARRRTGLGGSDAAAALGVSPWRTPYDLWLEKTEPIALPAPPSEPMRWGTLLEPVIMQEYTRRTGRAVEAAPDMLRHPKYSWMIGHLDGRVEDRILEVKTARDARGWGEPGSDEIPLHYLTQTHHYLVVSGAVAADVAVLIGGSDFRIYQVRADPDIAEALISAEAAFWKRIENRDPPPPVNPSDAARRWGRLAAPGAVIADAHAEAAIGQLRTLRAQMASLATQEDIAKAIVMQALGDAGDSLYDPLGELLCTWKLDGGRKGYTVEAREPARRFLLK